QCRTPLSLLPIRPPTPPIYTLPLHDALPIFRRASTSRLPASAIGPRPMLPWPGDAIVVCSFGDASLNHANAVAAFNTAGWCDHRSEEHTSELQSRENLVCRLLLETKKHQPHT